jgi:hypothetical protein
MKKKKRKKNTINSNNRTNDFSIIAISQFLRSLFGKLINEIDEYFEIFE